jgi:hypothetical protein
MKRRGSSAQSIPLIPAFDCLNGRMPGHVYEPGSVVRTPDRVDIFRQRVGRATGRTTVVRGYGGQRAPSEIAEPTLLCLNSL